MSFTAAGETVTRTVECKAGVDHLLAPRRYILETLVAEAAAGDGVHMRLGVTVSGVRFDNTGQATDVHGRDRAGSPVEISARCVVGADGLARRHG